MEQGCSMSKDKISIVAADDHQIFIDGIESLFSSIDYIELIASANDGDTLLTLINSLTPNIVLLDLSMPGATTQDIIAQVTEQYPSTKLIALSMYHDAREAKLLLTKGIAGYVLKESAFDDLINAIQQVHNGIQFVSHTLDVAINALPNHELSAFLTQREKLILTGAAQGNSNKKIANNIGISERTVRFHLANCCEKLKAQGRSNAVAVALNRHLIELD